jgi:hypothetical protein
MSRHDYTPYQQGLIKRYYEYRETLALQKLGEIVSDLYIESSEARIARAWGAAHKQMLAAGVHPHEAKSILKERDLGALARLIARSH